MSNKLEVWQKLVTPPLHNKLWGQKITKQQFLCAAMPVVNKKSFSGSALSDLIQNAFIVNDSFQFETRASFRVEEK